MKNLMNNCVGAPDEEMEEREIKLMEQEEQIEDLQKELYMIKNQKDTKLKTRDEKDSIIKDLSKQNASLRLKISDLQDKMQELSMQVTQ